MIYSKYYWVMKFLAVSCQTDYTLHPESAEIISLGSQTYVFQRKIESKNGFKTINCRPYPVLFFFKKLFLAPKIIKKIERFVDI